ncbi:hypothetical protein LWI28_011120 [Acer negundo]|uniref:Uncharacterized protein n=1 Tax=Acer negundo TaxID=4023 RepID=A0AAD5IM27_ACENE|nr:hypothetical protein LWI28_011120 [Acer negundo]
MEHKQKDEEREARGYSHKTSGVMRKERERTRNGEIVVAAVAESAALSLSAPSPSLVDAVFSYRPPPLLLLVDAVAVSLRHRLQLPIGLIDEAS